MTEEFQLNDDTYTGTKEVSENLKFESKLLHCLLYTSDAADE